MMEIDWSPDVRKLKQFGLISLVSFALLGTVAMWVWKLPSFATVFFIAGPLIFLVSMVHASAVKPVYLGLTVAALPIGFVVSHLLLAVLYYLVLTPIGLFFKIIGTDLLNRKFDRQARTYWQFRTIPNDPSSYFRQC